MALVQITGEDSWLNDYEYAGSLLSEINQATVRRRQFHLGDLEHAALSSQLRKEIPQAELQIATLFKALESSSKYVIPGERERRHRLCENLLSTLRKASEEFHRGLPQQGPFTKVADLGTVNWGEDETEVTRQYTNEELKYKHQSIIQAQDSALEGLAEVVGSQKRIAKSIQVEVEGQDELLNDIKERVGDTQNSLEQQTSNVANVTRESSTKFYWIIIIILLIAIILVAVL